MSLLKSIYSPIRIVTGIIFLIWAAIHFYLSTKLLAFLPMVGGFFIFDSILAVIAAAFLFINFRALFLPILAYSMINYLLITESRVFPAPFLGHPLPTINVYVIVTIILDILAITLTTVTWIASRR